MKATFISRDPLINLFFLLNVVFKLSRISFLTFDGSFMENVLRIRGFNIIAHGIHHVFAIIHCCISLHFSRNAYRFTAQYIENLSKLNSKKGAYINDVRSTESLVVAYMNLFLIKTFLNFNIFFVPSF